MQTRPPLNPLLLTFLKITALVAIGIVALKLFGYLFNIIIVAAIIAAVVIGGFFAYSFIKNRRLPMIR